MNNEHAHAQFEYDRERAKTDIEDDEEECTHEITSYDKCAGCGESIAIDLSNY